MPNNTIIPTSVRIAQYLLHRYRDDRCSEIAAALVYMSLFALVPLLTVIYAVAAAVPAAKGLQQQLEGFLQTHLLPETTAGVTQYLSSFTESAQNLSGVGFAILLVTAVLMLRNVERAFNIIWRTRGNRAAVASFLLYWAILSLTPILLASGLAASAYLFAAANALINIESLGISTLILPLLPTILGVVNLTLIYMAVPNCPVPPKHAVIGAIIATLAFAIAKKVFALVMAKTSYSLVYGAFAAIPVLLLWLYLTWNIVLFGGIVVHSLSAYQNADQASRPLLLKALDVLYVFWRNQRTGEAISELALLNDKEQIIGGLDGDSWRHIRDTLMDKGVVAQNARGRYLLARDLSTLSVDQLRLWLSNSPTTLPNTADLSGWRAHVNTLLSDDAERHKKALAINLQSLFLGDTSQS